MPRHNDNTIKSFAKLKEDLARSRRWGYYIDDEEDEIGYRCIGVPVCDETGEVAAAISVTGSTAQVREENSTELAKQVMRTVESIAESFLEESSNPARDLKTV